MSFPRGATSGYLQSLGSLYHRFTEQDIAHKFTLCAGWLNRSAPKIYLAYALPLILFLSLVMPPLSAPDEWDHTARAISIAHGHLTPSRSEDGKRVALIDQNFLVLVLDIHKALWKKHRWSWAPMMQHRADVWGNTFLPDNYASQGYFPLGFVPQVLFLRAAIMAKWPMVASLRWGRLFLGVIYSLCAAALLAWARSSRMALLMVFACPLSLFLFASFSPDPVIILLASFLAISLSRNWGRPDVPQFTALAALFAGFVICALKTVYLPLFLLFLIGYRKAVLKSLTSTLLAGGAILAALLWNRLYVQPPDRSAEGIDPAAQMHFLLSDPLVVFPVAIHTLTAIKAWFLLDLFNFTKVHWPALPFHFMVIMLAGMALVFVLDPLRPPNGKAEAGLWSLGAILLTMALSFAALYLSWTKVGSMGPVQGFQGRYLLPLLPLLLLSFGLLPYWQKVRHAALCLVMPLWLTASAIATVWLATNYVLPYYP